MTSDQEITSALQSSGIPVTSIYTTLAKEKCLDIRGWTRPEVYAGAAGYRGIYVHPQRPKDNMKARRVFYTVAKEMVLAGQTCYGISLSLLVHGMNADFEETAFTRADSANFVFIADFYEDGAAFPLSAWQAGRLRSWVRERFERGLSVSLLGDKPLSGTHSWWPVSFTGFLSEKMDVYAVGGD